MIASPDFKELLSIFNDNSVLYLVVGGYAVMRYTEPRFTKDLDLWISTTPDNAERVYHALKQFGAPMKGLVPADFTDVTSYYQMGRPPFRLDVIMGLKGLDFDRAYNNRNMVQILDIEVPFISIEDLIIAKEHSGRPQDLIDLANLKKSQEI